MSNPLVKNAKDRGIQSLDREENTALYHKIREGDVAAQEQMVVGNIPLVLVRVSGFLVERPQFEHLRDDLQSECYLALVRVVQTFAAGDEVDNVVGYIYTAMAHAMVNFANRGEAVSHSPGAIKKAIETKNHITHPQKADIDIGLLEATDTTRAALMLNVIEACCIDDTERRVIELREMGFTDQEVEEETGIPRRTVQRVREDIYARYLEVTGLQKHQKNSGFSPAVSR